MNIKEELKELSTNGKSTDEVVSEIYAQYDFLEKQQNELLKKAHLFNVIGIANKLENAIAQEFFASKDIEWLEYRCVERPSGYIVLPRIFGKKTGHDIKNQETFIEKTFECIQNFNLDFAKDEVTTKDYLELKPGIKEKILNLFLSDELKNILDYNKMDLYLPVNNSNNEKKFKV